jgi:hypothetical protein
MPYMRATHWQFYTRLVSVTVEQAHLNGFRDLRRNGEVGASGLDICSQSVWAARQEIDQVAPPRRGHEDPGRVIKNL